jgi:hypothetical protein
VHCYTVITDIIVKPNKCTSAVFNFTKYLLHVSSLNPLNAELNPICHLLALLGAHRILHVSRIRVKGPSSGT